MAEYSITATDRRVVYDGSSGTGPYAFSFPVLVETDIAVFKNATKLSLTTDYTVTIDSSNGTGSVTLDSAATGSDTITITGARAIERTTDFVTAGDLLASSLNTELDSQTIFAQQVSEDADRAIKAPVTDPTSIDMTLPAKADRLGKLMGFDASTGNPEATTGRVNTVSVSTSDVAAGGNSTGSATFTDSTGALALSLGVVVGDTGATGAQGVSSGIEYNYSSTTSDADPSAGNFRINGSFGAGTQIFISDQSAATGNPNVSAFILTFDDSTNSADRGTLTIKKKSAPENFATYKISGASTDASSYVKLAVTAVASSGSLSNSDACVIEFSRAGNAGAGSGDLLAANNLSDLASAATARTNLGLGSAAVLTAGTSANNAVQLNGSAELPAVSGANLTNLPVSDVSSDIRFIALQTASDRIGISGNNGIADPFSDESDVSTSAFIEDLGGKATVGNTHSGDSAFAAQRFTVGSTGGTVSQVKFHVQGQAFASGTDIRVETSDGSTTPTGTLVDSNAVLTTGAISISTDLQTENFPGSFTLAANTEYWIVVSRNATGTYGVYRATSLTNGTGAFVGSFQSSWELGLYLPLNSTADSSNETFDSSSTAYINTASSTVSQSDGTAIGNATGNGGLAAAFDDNLSQAYSASAENGSNSTFIGKNWGSGVYKIITSIKVYASSSHNIQGSASTAVAATFTIQGSTDNFSSSTVDLGTGSLSLGAGDNATLAATDTSTAFQYHRVKIDTPTGNCAVAELIFTEQTVSNMTLVSNAFTAQSAPGSAIIGVQTVETDSITINTDLQAEVSRDNGSNFTQCTLALKSSLGATGTKYYESASTDISSQPSGTSVKYRIKTLNSKRIAVHGVALKWA